jgi:hypothetical protein
MSDTQMSSPTVAVIGAVRWAPRSVGACASAARVGGQASTARAVRGTTLRHSSLGALTPTEFAVLKGLETLPPPGGEITGGLCLSMMGNCGVGQWSMASR